MGLNETSESDFSVQTFAIVTDDTTMYCHWAEGLIMILSKNGVVIELNSDEIRQLVKSLPLPK